MVVESENNFSFTKSICRETSLSLNLFKNIVIFEDLETNIDEQFETIHDRIQSNFVELKEREILVIVIFHIMIDIFVPCHLPHSQSMKLLF